MENIKSSGEVREFETGSHRDMAVGKGRMDLVPSYSVLKCLAVLDEVNKCKGQGWRQYLIQALEYAERYLNEDDLHSLFLAASYSVCALGLYEGDKIVEGYSIKDTDDVYSMFSAGLIAISKHYEEGGAKYGDNNWKLGQPLHVLMDSGTRHLCKAIANIDDEPHLRAIAWNYMCAIWTEFYLPNMRDIKFDKKQN